MTAPLVRANSPLHSHLGSKGIEFLEFALDAVNRLLPHTETVWHEDSREDSTRAVWESNARTGISLTIDVSDPTAALYRCFDGLVTRRSTGRTFDRTKTALDTREHAICRALAGRLKGLLKKPSTDGEQLSLAAIRARFDEQVVAAYLQENHGLELDLTLALDAMHKLGELTYENKSISFGVLFDPSLPSTQMQPVFPYPLLDFKRYRALSDGFKTCYAVSGQGRLQAFLDLEKSAEPSGARDANYPYWAESMANVSRGRKLGISLTRQGDILAFDEGMLRLSYRFGKWQYWNHAHLTTILSSLARGQKTNPEQASRVARAVYRSALDVSFRRTGGLFVVLKNRRKLGDIVRSGDAIRDFGHGTPEWQFAQSLPGKNITSISRPVLAELSGLDGAIVIDKSGEILAFGSVLAPRRSGRLRGTEGSRTKAAIGASYSGLAVKISADGDISAFDDGSEIFRV